MTEKDVSDPNLKIDPAPNSNTVKEPDDWVSGNDPMTGAQASYLKTLSEECDEPETFQADLTKAEASKRIDALKAKRSSVRQRQRCEPRLCGKRTPAPKNLRIGRYRPTAIS